MELSTLPAILSRTTLAKEIPPQPNQHKELVSAPLNQWLALIGCFLGNFFLAPYLEYKQLRPHRHFLRLKRQSSIPRLLPIQEGGHLMGLLWILYLQVVRLS